METIRNVRVKELLLILARLNVAFDLVDIIYDPRNGLLIIPTEGTARPIPLTKEEKEKVEKESKKIDPNIGLGDLIG